MDDKTLLILAGSVILLMMILLVIVLIRLSVIGDRSKRMEEDLRNEMDRSRQETVVTVQNSVRNLAEIIAQNQKDSATIQNRRLVEMNHQLHESLEQMNKGLGEMQGLAISVGDLQKILSNVKTRGIVGEVQLGAILEQILAPDQYEENIPVTGTSERVEFAVKFPGEGDRPVYLPIDSKFPADAYVKLQNAYESGDRQKIRQAGENMKNAVLKAARDIRNKYVLPPYTTEFAILFLPFEGLYAEVLRMGLVDRLQREYRITIAGPTTVAAILNSFQMGFRSLALQKQSGQVWDTLSKVRTEFDRFGEVLTKTQMRLEQTQSELEKLVGVRTRSIQRALENVDSWGTYDSEDEEQE